MIDPFEDDSRWTMLGSRFDPDWDSYEELGAMIDEQMERLPVDDPARLLWHMLPKARRPAPQRSEERPAPQRSEERP